MMSESFFKHEFDYIIREKKSQALNNDVETAGLPDPRARAICTKSSIPGACQDHTHKINIVKSNVQYYSTFACI